VQELGAIVDESPYANIAELAVRFVLDEPAVSSVVLGASTAQQVTRNVPMVELPPVPQPLRAELVERFAGRDEEFNTGG
jgi:aryl-alcohol dehydrogenase-like predicted oxidoreductase